jgi:hypothetical protein
MNTDRTQTVRPPALPNRTAAPAEQPAANGFAALLDAHAAPRREGDAPVRRDDRAPRNDRPERHETHTAAPREPRPAEHADPREAARRDLIAAGAPVVEQELHAAPEAPFVAQIAPALPTGEATVAPAIAPTLVAPELPTAAQAVVPAPTAAPQAPATEAPAVAAQTNPLSAAPTPATSTPAQVLADTAAQAAAGQPQAEAAVAETPAPTVADGQAPAPRVPAESARTPELPQAVAPADEPSGPAQPAPSAATPSQPKAEPQAAVPAAPSAPVTAAPDVQTPAPLTGQTAPQRAVPLHRAPAAVATLLHVAAERGITHAKMALKPAELGGIEIRLQSTAAGVAAQVVADSPEAARLLAQAGDDLRRALEARDVTLVSLEVSTSSDQQRESARGEWSDGDGNDAGRFGSSSRSTGDADGDAEPTPTTHSVIELPGGLLVDVLA